MKAYLWDHAQMHARRAALAVIAGGIVGCTAHAIPSTALAELPLAGLSAPALNSGGTLPPDARTDGSTPLFDGSTRAIRLANFDLSDPAPRDAAGPGDLAVPIAALAEFDRLRQRGSEYAVLPLPWVRPLKFLTPQIRPSREFLDRTTDLLLTYNLDHAFDLTEACEQSMKAKTLSTFTLEGDVQYMVRPLHRHEVCKAAEGARRSVWPRRRPRKVVDELQSDGGNPLTLVPNGGSKVLRAVDAADAAQIAR